MAQYDFKRKFKQGKGRLGLKPKDHVDVCFCAQTNGFFFFYSLCCYDSKQPTVLVSKDIIIIGGKMTPNKIRKALGWECSVEITEILNKLV